MIDEDNFYNIYCKKIGKSGKAEVKQKSFTRKEVREGSKDFWSSLTNRICSLTSTYKITAKKNAFFKDVYLTTISEEIY